MLEIRSKLRPYQNEAVEAMINSKATVAFPNTQAAKLEYDDMGLGKTLTTLCAVAELKAFPCIIVCPKFALYVWQSEIKHWLGMDSTVYSGKPAEREKQWQEFVTSGNKFLITNYEMLAEIGVRSGIKVKELRTAINQPGTWKWGGIIWDEIHIGGLFNHKSKNYKVSLAFAREIPVRFPLTGTPFRQGCIDLYAPLSLVDPKTFDSYWKFVNKWCTVIPTPFGKEIERNPSNITAFRSMLNRYVVRRLKEEVLQELPGKTRQPLVVKMNSEQQKIYDELVENLMAEIPDTDEIIITPGQMTLIMRLRQLLTAPQVLGLKHRGAAIDAIIEHSHLRMDDNRPIVVFTPFRKALPYLREAFEAEYPGVKIYEIRGQLTAEEFASAWQGFQNDKYKKKVMFCVIKSGASFQATAADTGYFLGCEYDFTLNEQAEDRLNRMGQKNFVNFYYTMHAGTVEESIMDILNSKKSSSTWVMGSELQYQRMLREIQGLKKLKK